MLLSDISSVRLPFSLPSDSPAPFYTVADSHIYQLASPTPTTSTSANRRPIPQSQIETVSNMFPSITTVAIRYELERTGGNVQGVVERCLRDGRLPEVSWEGLICISV